MKKKTVKEKRKRKINTPQKTSFRSRKYTLPTRNPYVKQMTNPNLTLTINCKTLVYFRNCEQNIPGTAQKSHTNSQMYVSIH